MSDYFVVLSALSKRSCTLNDVPAVPEALLNLQEVRVIDFWIQQVRHLLDINKVYILTDREHRQVFVEWSQSRGLSTENILSIAVNNQKYDSLTSHIQLFLNEKSSVTNGKTLIFIEVGTVINEDFKLNLFVESLIDNMNGIVCHSIDQDSEDSSISNVIDLNINHTTNLVTPPAEENLKSTNKDNLYKPIVYVCRNATVSHIMQNILSNHGSSGHKYENLIYNSMMASNIPVKVEVVHHIYQTWKTDQYQQICNIFSTLLNETILQLPDTVTRVCSARVGLMGNPSDGFGGKTLSFLINNFSAKVTITTNKIVESENAVRDLTVSFIPNSTLDPSSYNGMDHYQLHIINKVHQRYSFTICYNSFLLYFFSHFIIVTVLNFKYLSIKIDIVYTLQYIFKGLLWGYSVTSSNGEVFCG